MKIEFERSDASGKPVRVEVEGCDVATITFYYWLVQNGYAMASEKPSHIPEHYLHELTVEISLNGMFGGPQVVFQDLYGRLLDLVRSDLHANMSIHLPGGGVSARDGIGDWTKVIGLSKKPVENC